MNLCSSAETQSHLSRVYATLVMGVLFSALGVYIEGIAHVAGLMTQIATIGMLLWLLLDSDVANTPKVCASCCRCGVLCCLCRCGMLWTWGVCTRYACVRA